MCFKAASCALCAGSTSRLSVGLQKELETLRADCQRQANDIEELNQQLADATEKLTEQTRTRVAKEHDLVQVLSTSM
jgi:uncharacterized membrane protein